MPGLFHQLFRNPAIPSSPTNPAIPSSPTSTCHSSSPQQLSDHTDHRGQSIQGLPGKCFPLAFSHSQVPSTGPAGEAGRAQPFPALVSEGTRGRLTPSTSCKQSRVSSPLRWVGGFLREGWRGLRPVWGQQPLGTSHFLNPTLHQREGQE